MDVGSKRKKLAEKKYYMTDRDNQKHHLKETKSERDLGFQVNNNLKWGEQAFLASTKANQVLEILKKDFKYRAINSWRTLYVT